MRQGCRRGHKERRRQEGTREEDNNKCSYSLIMKSVESFLLCGFRLTWSILCRISISVFAFRVAVCDWTKTNRSHDYHRSLMVLRNISEYESRGLYYEAGFGVSEVTSGLTLGFQDYDGGSLLTGVHRHGNFCCDPNLLRSESDDATCETRCLLLVFNVVCVSLYPGVELTVFAGTSWHPGEKHCCSRGIFSFLPRSSSGSRSEISTYNSTAY